MFAPLRPMYKLDRTAWDVAQLALGRAGADLPAAPASHDFFQHLGIAGGELIQAELGLGVVQGILASAPQQCVILSKASYRIGERVRRDGFRHDTRLSITNLLGQATYWGSNHGSSASKAHWSNP